MPVPGVENEKISVPYTGSISQITPSPLVTVNSRGPAYTGVASAPTVSAAITAAKLANRRIRALLRERVGERRDQLPCHGGVASRGAVTRDRYFRDTSSARRRCADFDGGCARRVAT